MNPLPLAAAMIALTGAPARHLSSTAALHLPKRVTVGHWVTLVAAGYQPDSRVSFGVQAATYRGSNGGAIRLGHSQYRVPASGKLRVRIRWPNGYYVGCTAVGCSHPPKPWRDGERADVFASDSTGSQYAEARVIVRR